MRAPFPNLITGGNPADEIEATMIVQMAAVHVAMMRHLNELADAEEPWDEDRAERILNKLAGIYAEQVKALQKYRSRQ
jgi:hypothetical protein